jgi:serpin B
MPDFFGLARVNDYLLFGELDATQVYEGEELAINWGDGSPDDVITFSHQITWDNNGKPRYRQLFMLNGKVVDGQITIYKDLKTPAPTDSPRSDIPLNSAEIAYVSSINDFGLRLMRQMISDPAIATSNYVFSPLNATFAVSMLSCGAGLGQTEQNEVLRAFTGQAEPTHDLISQDVFNSLFQKIIEYLPLTDASVSAYMANALFLRNDFTLYAGYPDFLANYYSADYARLDFSSPEALTYINDWSKQKTHGLLTKTLGHVSADDVAYFLSAAILKAAWSVPFDKQLTSRHAFTTADGTTAQVPMMHSTRTAPFATAAAFQAVKLPFGNGALELTAMLPAAGQTPASLLRELTAQQLDDIAWKDAVVEIALPTFISQACHSKLISQLGEIGIKRMFSPNASYKSITPDEGFKINLLQQNVLLAFDENGCQTGTDADNASAQETETEADHTFLADRPFLYFIREISSGAIIFTGYYNGPESVAN